ncbi:superoxide dismutase family protein [Microbacteriaceae bacterium 4G12]
MKMRFASLWLTMLVFAGCAQGEPKQVKVELHNSAGDKVGTATLSEHPGGMQIKLKAEGFTPGSHGLHIHEVGECKDPDFTSSGNHFNSDKKKHGLLNEKGAENGDLPNVTADANGKIKAKFIAPNVSFKEGKKTLRRKNGASLIITENPDDGMTQPTGNSGKRLACGVIVKKSTAYKKST